MVRLLVGVFLASIALFFFGYLYWGMTTVPYRVWSVPNDEAGATEALKRHFPVRGTYFLPIREKDDAETEAKFRRGPLAFVSILSTTGRSMVDPKIMIRGYLLSVFVLMLIGLQLRQVRSSLPGYFSRVAFATVAGLTATLMIDVGDGVWWELPMDWQLCKGLYHLVSWLIAGLVLGLFTHGDAPDTQRAAAPT